jgi:hypothetical protein
MNPNTNESSIQLPVPVEQLPNANTGEKGNNKPSTGAESFNTASPAPMAAIPLPALPLTQTNVQQTNAHTSIGSQGNPAYASDDADLIEKEWINKAKQIVEQTRDDPYKQSEELTVFKADYMKKRYNRTIKLK